MKQLNYLSSMLLTLLVSVLPFGKTVAQEAYVHYDNNGTLTFYYDGERNDREGKIYNLNTGYSDVGWYNDGTYKEVTEVVFDDSFKDARPTTMSCWFRFMEKLQSIKGMDENLNTSEVTSMSSLFQQCKSLTHVDVSHFNTRHVTDMSNMFMWCDALEEVDVSHFDTRNVTTMVFMFYECNLLKTLDLSCFDTGNVTAMNLMFYACDSLTTIYVSHRWSTANVTSSTNMFNLSSSLVGGAGTVYSSKHVDASYAHVDGGTDDPGYLTLKVVPEAYAEIDGPVLTFYYDTLRSTRTGTTYNLNEGDEMPAWSEMTIARKVQNAVFDSSFADARPTTTRGWFANMSNLNDIIGMESYLNTSEVTNMRAMFANCTKLRELDLSAFDTQNVTTMRLMFRNCVQLEELDLTSFDTHNVTDMNNMFYDCVKLEELDLTTFDTRSVEDMEAMFVFCNNLETIYVGSNWNTDNVTSSDGMFSGCDKLVGGAGTKYDGNYVDASYAHFDGGSTNPGYLTFRGPYVVFDNGTLTFYCDTQRGLRTGTTYDLNSGENFPAWIGDVTYSCEHVKFDASFKDARPTTTLTWFFHLSNLTDIEGMAENLNTSEVTCMNGMFNKCEKLTSLDLSGFDTGKVKSMRNMFAQSTGLKTIYIGNGWSTEAVTASDNMFGSCQSLVGGAGTRYDANHIDAAYAHDDGGTANPGYLTLKLEAYAEYADGTLTFYRDADRSQRTGETFDLNSGDNYPAWSYDPYKGRVADVATEISRVVFDASFAKARPTTTAGWFSDLSNLYRIEGMKENLNTSEVTDMGSMFANCTSLSDIDLRGFNTLNVKNMGYMFYQDEGTWNNLTTLDLSRFNTSNVENMEAMFNNCVQLEAICVGDNWNTDKVTSSMYMFTGCYNLVGGAGTVYDESHVDKTYARIDGGTSRPGYLTKQPEAYAAYRTGQLIFYYDGARASRQGSTYLLHESYDSKPAWAEKSIRQVIFHYSFANYRPTSTANWFNDMSNLTTIMGMENLNTSEVTDMSLMFCGCSSLTFVELGFFDTQNVTDMEAMFHKCSAIEYLNLRSFDTRNVESMKNMFSVDTELKTIYVGPEWSTDSVTESTDMFFGCSQLRGANGTVYDANHLDAAYAHLDGGTADPGYLTLAPYEAYAEFVDGTLTFYCDYNRVAHKGRTFSMNYDEAAPAWHFDPETGEEVDWYCDPDTGEETSLVRKVTAVVFDPSFAKYTPQSCYGWFSGMTNLTTITGMKAYLNTSLTEHMAFMFANCSSLESLDVSAFDTRNVKTMYAMFRNCSSLQTLDVTNFNTSRVTNMFCLFEGCSHLTSIDVSHFDTRNVTSLESMFENCWSLETLDLSAFDTHNVTSTMRMFIECQALTTITVGDKWTMENVDMENYGSDLMFYDCYKLVGGAGTTYAEWRVDGRYAHIDGGPDNPGYFTAAFLKGDVNNDGQVGIGDIVAITNVMAGIETDAGIVSRADVNGDTQVGIGDIVAVTNIMAGVQ